MVRTNERGRIKARADRLTKEAAVCVRSFPDSGCVLPQQLIISRFSSLTLTVLTLGLPTTTTNGKTTWTDIRHLHSFPDLLYWIHLADMDNMALVWQ